MMSFLQKQIRNIEAELKVKILDRTSLILDIFCHACANSKCQNSSRTGSIQIYVAPSATLVDTLGASGRWIRAGGGKGSVGLRGPGETQLEMDRRIILNRMSLLKERLAEIDKQK